VRYWTLHSALAVNKHTSDAILEYATSVLAEGTTHPAFYNDDAIIRSLVDNYGVKREDAVKYIHTTCAEISVVGKTKSYTTPYEIDLPKTLHRTVAEYPECKTAEEVINRVMKEIKNTLIEHSGVAGHPGDRGMEAIAERIWEKVSPLL